MVDLTGIFVPIALFLSIFGMVYIFLTTRTKERLALIEKGADAALFKTARKPIIILKFALLCIGVGIGILVGNFCVYYMKMNEETAFPAMIFLFGGIGLLVAYFIEKKLEKKNHSL